MQILNFALGFRFTNVTSAAAATSVVSDNYRVLFSFHLIFVNVSRDAITLLTVHWFIAKCFLAPTLNIYVKHFFVLIFCGDAAVISYPGQTF